MPLKQTMSLACFGIPNPRAPVRIGRGLGRWVERQGCTSIAELRGGVVGT